MISKMDIKELLISLKRQEENLTHLLQAAKNKQRAIVENKLQKLEEVISEEERIINGIAFQEKHRIEMLNEFIVKLNLELKRPNLSDFLAEIKPRLDPKFYDELIRIRTEIVKITGEINKINAQNKILIAQSISFIKKTITSLVDTKRNSLIDRRI